MRSSTKPKQTPRTAPVHYLTGKGARAIAFVDTRRLKRLFSGIGEA